jgi:hypothetical protein
MVLSGPNRPSPYPEMIPSVERVEIASLKYESSVSLKEVPKDTEGIKKKRRKMDMYFFILIKNPSF